MILLDVEHFNLMKVLNSKKSDNLWNLFYRYWRWYFCLNYHLKAQTDTQELLEKFKHLNQEMNLFTEKLPLDQLEQMNENDSDFLESISLQPHTLYMLQLMREERDRFESNYRAAAISNKKK